MQELAPAVPEAQKQSAVYRHPRRDEIERLMRSHTSAWIAAWLRQEYPVCDPDGQRLQHARQAERLRIGARTLERYRRRFLPETAPGVDVMPAAIADIVGRNPPRPQRHDIERLDALQEIGMHLLGVAMQDDQLRQQDAAMVREALTELVQRVKDDPEVEPGEILAEIAGMKIPAGLSAETLRAYRAVTEAAAKSIAAKSLLGLPGYEPATQKLDINQTSQNLSIALTGRIDEHGNPQPNEPDKLETLRRVLERGPAAARDIAGQAREEIVDVEVVE